MTITAGFVLRPTGNASDIAIPIGLRLLRAATNMPVAAWAAAGLAFLRERVDAPLCLTVFDPRMSHLNEPDLGDWELGDDRTTIEADLLQLARSVLSQSDHCHFFYVSEDWATATPLLYRRGGLSGFSQELHQTYPFARCYLNHRGEFAREQEAFLFEFTRDV